MVPLINELSYIPQLVRPHLVELVSEGKFDLKSLRHMGCQNRIRVLG